MLDKYVVVHLEPGQEPHDETYDDYSTAKEAVDEAGHHCLILRVENICDQGFLPTTVKVEYHL